MHLITVTELMGFCNAKEWDMTDAIIGGMASVTSGRSKNCCDGASCFYVLRCNARMTVLRTVRQNLLGTG